MEYCSKCVYPIVSATPINFDQNGICSGCKVNSTKIKIDWQKRWNELENLINEYKNKSYYDIVIPVSGGKDSYFQTYIAIEKLKLKPLLVTYYGNNFTKIGEDNLNRMKDVFNCDHLIFKPSKEILIKMNRLGFKIQGDMNWHNHCGIMTLPIQIACKFKIPLMLWGEHGQMDLGGMFSYNDYVEFTAKHRKEFHLRGYDWSDFIEPPSISNVKIEDDEKLNEKDLIWAKYPSDKEILDIGLRGIYLSNYVSWDGNENARLMKELYNWQEADVPFERTYRTISNLDDMHENGIHDYMKFVKFGYGRTTDHASKDIRSGNMSRKQAIIEVLKRDHIKSKDLDRWLNYVKMSEDEFNYIADTFRDNRVWFIKNNMWYKHDLDGKYRSYGKVYLPKEIQTKYIKEF